VSDYRLDNRGSVPGLCVQTSCEAYPESYPIGTGSKARPGRDTDHSPSSSAEITNKELYLLSLLVPAWLSGTALLCFYMLCNYVGIDW
jgi:hypothetical protein